jgi:multicomponent Na+:H+ antiporter subunit B
MSVLLWITADFMAAQRLGTAARHYQDRAVAETGATNIVTAILFDYRGLDTLIEGSVIFAAAAIAVVLFRSGRTPVLASRPGIVRREIGLLTPFIFVLGLYVILYGHISPGGGFQGGVILATPIILFHILYGSVFRSRMVHPGTNTTIESCGALIFLLTGLACILAGGRFLAISRLPLFHGRPGTLLSGGVIPLLNVAVGLKIGAAMVLIFHYMFREE